MFVYWRVPNYDSDDFFLEKKADFDDFDLVPSQSWILEFLTLKEVVFYGP